MGWGFGWVLLGWVSSWAGNLVGFVLAGISWRFIFVSRFGWVGYLVELEILFFCAGELVLLEIMSCWIFGWVGNLVWLEV